MIDTNGELSTTFDFSNKNVYCSCGVTHKNEYFIYGSRQVKTRQQVLKVIGCRLESLADLNFNHQEGTCASSNEIVLGPGDT